MKTTTLAPERLPANNCKRYFAHVRPADIDSFPYNYRQHFDEASLAELAESIKQQGLIEPVIVQAMEDYAPYKYVGIAGERRWRAAKLAGLEEIPCIVYEGLDDEAALGIALVENLQRQDVNAMEEAAGYAMLRDKVGLTQQEIAERIGRPRSSVANTLRLLNLPPDVQEHISTGKLTKAHGLALMRFAGYDEVIRFIATAAIEAQTPAGELEQGMPCSWRLRDEGLVYKFSSWEVSEDYWPAKRAVFKQCMEEDKGKGWIEECGDYYVLNPERGVEVKTKMIAAQDKYEREHPEEDDDDEIGEEDPERKAERLKREREYKERQEQLHTDLNTAAELMHAWTKKHNDPKKGPTRGSAFMEWENAVKAVFYIFEDWLVDVFMDLDEDLWKGLFDVPQDRESIDTDELRQMIFKLPAHAIIETMISVEMHELAKQLDSEGTPWGAGRYLAIANLLNGKELES